MRVFFAKPYRIAAVYAVFLTLAFTYVLLDTFVIPRAQMPIARSIVSQAEQISETPQISIPEDTVVSSGSDQTEYEAEDPPMEDIIMEPIITDSSYVDGDISIEIETLRKYNTTLYVADIRLTDVSLLKTAFAQNTFGRNIKETTSTMAESQNAILAINGDYYGFRDAGYVLRNGELYRDIGNGADMLVIDLDGNFSIVNENDVSAKDMLEDGAWQTLSFGPALMDNGEISVNISSEIEGRSAPSNPRTAIGQAGPLHYVFIVSDGRSNESAGFSLFQLAEEFAERGCSVAYNLDGGGSSTMVFNGAVINNPTNGRSTRERELSDIVYIGYE